MSSEKRNKLSEIFKLAWQFVKRNGYKLSEALKCAWLNIKLKAEMKKRIVNDEKGTHGGPNGYISCEGRCCQEAYEMYIEEWTE